MTSAMSVHQRFIEHGGHADRLRENRGIAGAGHAVQSFVPPVVFGNAEAQHGVSSVANLRNLFFKRHARDEIVDALFKRQAGILESPFDGGLLGRGKAGAQYDNVYDKEKRSKKFHGSAP